MASTSSSPVTPSFIPRIASQASPIATASPWRRRPYPPDFSIACPMVCPRLRILRSEVSLSSRSTTDALNPTARRTTQRHSSPESDFHFPPTARSRSHSSASPARAHLTTSAIPARRLRSSRVRRKASSMKTARGWWNAPTRFFPSGRLKPVFPPTLLSTWERRVVGTWMQEIPRRYVAAANPARSPTTPPPKATTRESRPASPRARNP